MGAEGFWNSRESAKKIIERANQIKNKLEPFAALETRFEDFLVLGEILRFRGERRVVVGQFEGGGAVLAGGAPVGARVTSPKKVQNRFP